MFKIESYVTPILLSYVDKYVKDFKPADAQVSLWEGGVVLHNLVLKTDVLQQEVALPFTLVSGRIHELLIQVPWTKIMSEPIIVTIDTIECILNISPETDESRPEKISLKTQMVEAPPGYMQALVRRIVSNISIRIHHLIVKYVHDDIVLSLNVKHLSIDSADASWKPTFADIEQTNPVIRRLVTLDDLTLCLDNSDSDGKIRFYQDPLLYRCGLSFRVLAKLISANTRRASNIEIELRTEKLAWGVTSDQLLLLLRLFKEREATAKSSTPTSPEKPQAPKQPQFTVSAINPRQQPSTTSNVSEPLRRESWSEWAWSWMPTTSDRDNSREEAPMAVQPLPLAFSAYLTEVSLVVKVLEIEVNNRKRPRSLLEFTALYAAIKCTKCAPTLLKVKLGIRYVLINSIGKCPCGHVDMNAASNQQTIYLCNKDEPNEWTWPVEKEQEKKVDKSGNAQEEPVKLEKIQEENGATVTEKLDQADETKVIEIKVAESKTVLLEENMRDNVPTLRSQKSLMLKPISGLDLFDVPSDSKLDKNFEETDGDFWDKLSPIVIIEFIHARSPPDHYTNPYDHSLTEFEYSDWIEESDIRVKIKPLDLRICMGLIHRLQFIKNLFGDQPPMPLAPMRTLTIEECEALNQNLPQRRINVELTDFRISVHPWNHSPTERPMPTPLLLLLELPKGNVIITTPLYAQRVCSAAGQMPKDDGVLWHGCRAHCTAALDNVKISVCAPRDDQSKPCGRINIRFVTHNLLYPEYFAKKDSILTSYAVKIREANISGSAARLQAAVEIILSLVNQQVSSLLYQTSLAKDALDDEGLVAMDITAEDLSARGFITKKVATFIFTLQSLRATVFHSSDSGELKQAWLFSGPEVATSTAYVRCAFQYCFESFPQEFNFFGLWTEPTAVALDPLLISWLSYQPVSKLYSDSNLQTDNKFVSSTQNLRRWATTPSSSSGRGPTRSGSASYAEQVHHIKSRSVDSSSEPSRNIPPVQPAPQPLVLGEELLKMYDLLAKVRIYIELGLILLYVTKKSASAVGCETVRVAMEDHAINSESVMVLSLGRWQMFSNTVPQHMWHYIKQDGPTYLKLEDDKKMKANESQFPWRMALSDVSCYSLELVVERQTGLSEPSGGLRSHLKTPTMARPVTILEHVSTNVTLSVVTKTLQHKMVIKKADSQTKQYDDNKKEAKLKFFTTGTEFRPTSFLEFLRGPMRRKKEFGTQSEHKEKTEVNVKSPVFKVTDGPIISLGINMHADTPPIVVRMEHKQVQQLAITVHCLSHVIDLLNRSPISPPRHNLGHKTSRTTIRSEADEETTSISESTRSESQSDRIMTIFTIIEPPESKGASTIKTFFWFQWVISRATVVITAEDVKIAIDIDDISSSIDLQQHYNQFKVKINSLVVKHFEKSEDGVWQAGALGGRVLEAREPINAQEDTHFLSTTITAARISSLPDNWKEELHPKLLEQKNNTDTMLELYAVLAPLDIVIVPDTLENIQSVLKAMTVNRLCSLSRAQEHLHSTFELPYVYLCAGGVKVLLACEVSNKKKDDTFMLTTGKIAINPHPENPICRRLVAAGETGWSASQGNLEGRQYELTIRNISLKTSNFFQLASEQESTTDKITSDNPAHKWSQPIAVPNFSTILHPLDIDLLYAPALILDGALVCGPAIEINLSSDCIISLDIDQVFLGEAAMTMRPVKQTQGQSSSDEGGLHESECPYADILLSYNSDDRSGSVISAIEDETPSGLTGTVDSGVEMTTSRSKSGHQINPVKKSVSIALLGQTNNASEYLEAFVTAGVFEISLYAIDDESKEIQMVRPQRTQRTLIPSKSEEEIKKEALERDSSDTESKLFTDKIRHVDYGWTQIDPDQGRRESMCERAVPLLHATFHQPNLYYWKRRSSKHLQVSLFNMWFGLGVRQQDYYWHSSILSTARGEPDPMTDIPPALATMKYNTGYGNAPFTSSASLQRGSLTLDVERPILIEASDENIRRLIGIYKLLQEKFKTNRKSKKDKEDNTQAEKYTSPLPYRIRRFFTIYSIEVANMQTSQIGLTCAGATLGWEGLSSQINMNTRRDQLGVRVFVTAMTMSTDSNTDTRQPIILPFHIGMQINARWEAWQRAEGGRSAKEPTIRILIDMDCLNVDLTPNCLTIVNHIQEIINKLKELQDIPNSEETEVLYLGEGRNSSFQGRTCSASSLSADDDGGGDHFYKDDLRSGAFKIVRGGQLPMAYQVTLYKHVVSWRYPHPRAITRLIAFPLPNQLEEVECALEFYSLIMNQWEPYVIIKLPVTESREISLYNKTPELMFSTTWRFRVLSHHDTPARYQFNAKMFQPTTESFWVEEYDPFSIKGTSEITAEQLSGILRVDSYFAPRSTPRIRLNMRFASLDIHVHNKISQLLKQDASLEGYYVSKPLMRSHRVLAVVAHQALLNFRGGTTAGTVVLFKTQLSSRIVECDTGTMEPLADTFTVQFGISVPENVVHRSRLRLCMTSIRVALHISRLRALQKLANEWQSSYNKHLRKTSIDEKLKQEALNETPDILEGKVSLWIHNDCSVALRLGQEGTDEIFPLLPGAKLAYRWRDPVAVKRLRFSLATSSVDWCWSNSIPFTEGECRVRLENPKTRGTSEGQFIFVSVKQNGAHKTMHLAGRLVLANMLKFKLMYKVRAKPPDSTVWRNLSSSELSEESIGLSIVSAYNSEMVLKIRFLNHDSGWSGDIPLKECPKENVPWLVKVPSEGEVPFISVWCRVARTRNDGRILASIWPLFVLRSHLTLDIDVLLTSDICASALETETRPPPLIQTAEGRGTITHLLAPGTTSARHTLSFQYRNIDCPVTRDAIPLHYGVTDTSVFDKRIPVFSANEVLADINEWLYRAKDRQTSESWPFSIVAKHWLDVWKPALLQPRCDVTVRYEAVRAGGSGCSLEVRLAPVLLVCNAALTTVTLRAHDAAPLCKLEAGTVISPPSIVLKKPFFMSIEMHRETFVSKQLEVCHTEPGRYGELPSGQVAVDHPTSFAIPCNNKVIILNLHYEIKEDINVMGLTAAYVFVNKLDCPVLISAVALTNEEITNPKLGPKKFKLIQPSKSGSTDYEQLVLFSLQNRWRGGDVTELTTYLCLALPMPESTLTPAHLCVPVRLGALPLRRPVAFTKPDETSMAVVITQHKHEGRWIVTLAEDPCPQFIVHNQTSYSVGVAQPLETDKEDTVVRAKSDCPGVTWFCYLKSGLWTHYSGPGHSFTQALPYDQPTPAPMLTFARLKVDRDTVWCTPVEITSGEQLVQLTETVTMKVRVRAHPHSTLVELQDVDSNDISASDIRNRLLDPSFYNDEDILAKSALLDVHNIERIGGNEKLLGSEMVQAMRRIDMRLLEMDLKEIVIQSEKSTTDFRKLHPAQTEPTVTIKERDSEVSTTGLSTVVEKTSRRRLSPEMTVTFEKSAEQTSEKTEARTKKVDVRAPEEKILLITPTTSKDKFGRLSDGGETIEEMKSASNLLRPTDSPGGSKVLLTDEKPYDWDENMHWDLERVRCVISSVSVELGTTEDARPLLAAHVDRAMLLLSTLNKQFKSTITIADVQVDNLQYDSGLYDFPVIATTRAEPIEPDDWPTVWNMFMEQNTFSIRPEISRFMISTTHESWTVLNFNYRELTEVEIQAGPLALYIEDAYITALVQLFRLAQPSDLRDYDAVVMAEAKPLQSPLRLRVLNIHPIDLTLTLHTAVRMYIALDQSPLHLNGFKLQNMFTSTECFTHALTVHYLSAAILGAGWVVGGLELLGAPGALAARVGGATGGVRGVASTAAAALLRSLSACAGSLARNLDLLAGDEEHARRAAAARRRPPDSFLGGLLAGFTNFAINILGAVGGLAHHPLVGVAVGESGGAAALRRSLVGALTKPLSATADLVAYAGHGLLKQTGWDPVPQPRPPRTLREETHLGWRRDCVRWTFRLADHSPLAGFEVLFDDAPVHILLTNRYIIVAEPESERILEMIDSRGCKVGPFQGGTVELSVPQKRNDRQPKVSEKVNEDDDIELKEEAMQRVAWYTGTDSGTSGGGAGGSETRVLTLVPVPGQTQQLHAALLAITHANADTHFSLI